MKHEDKNINEVLLDKAMEKIEKYFSPVSSANKQTECTISTDAIMEMLSGLADFDRNEVANQMNQRGYEVDYCADTNDVVWVYYVETRED